MERVKENLMYPYTVGDNVSQVKNQKLIYGINYDVVI